MANTNTGIEWADCTWNVCIGCAKVAQGCKHCYAETMAKRLARMGQDHYAAVVNDTGWNGRAVTVPEALSKPLRWRKPRRIFVNSMSDLYHDDMPFEFIAAVKGVQAATPQHTYIELTKRPKRMREFMRWAEQHVAGPVPYVAAAAYMRVGGGNAPGMECHGIADHTPWPLPNVIHGYSASTQADLDAGIADLRLAPSALRCLSLEPLIGPVDVSACLGLEWSEIGECWICERDHAVFGGRKIDWIIVGGESGPGARPCDVAWIRAIVEQCKAAGVPCFVKQLGDVRILSSGTGLPHYHEWFHQIKARKGADPSEWPADLRVRQFPEVARG